MSELEERLSSSSNDEDPLLRLASSFLIARGSKIQHLSKLRLADLIGRAKIGDIEGLASEAHLSNREALRFARSLSFIERTRDERSSFRGITKTQLEPRATTRQLLRTPDARKLAKELLAIFAEEAASKFASNRFVFLLSPTIDERALQNHFEICLRGRDIFNELQTKGMLGEARKLLSTLSLSEDKKPGRVEEETRKGAPSKESDLIRYFVSRRKMIEIAHSFLVDFWEIKTLTAFLISDKEENENISHSSKATALSSTEKLLTQILKALKEVEELGVPDAEGVISDAEIAINDELRSRRSSLDRERVKQLNRESRCRDLINAWNEPARRG